MSERREPARPDGETLVAAWDALRRGVDLDVDLDAGLLRDLSLLADDAREAADARGSSAFAPPEDLAERLFARSSLAAAASNGVAASRWTPTGDMASDEPRLVGPHDLRPAAPGLALVTGDAARDGAPLGPAVDGRVAEVIPLAPRRRRMQRWQVVVAGAAAVLGIALVGDAVLDGRLLPVRTPAVLSPGDRAAVDGGQGGDTGGADETVGPTVEDEASSTEVDPDAEATDEPTTLEELLQPGPVTIPGGDAPRGGGSRPGTGPAIPPSDLEGEPDAVIPSTPPAPSPDPDPQPEPGTPAPPDPTEPEPTEPPAPPTDPEPEPTTPEPTDPEPTQPPAPEPDPTTPPVVVTVVAEDDVDDTLQGRAVLVAVRGNDRAEGGRASVSVASDPSGGTAAPADGGIRYQPVPTFVGTDTFTYTLCIGSTCDDARVTVVVTESGSAPVLEPDSAVAAVGETVPIAVLGNDDDPDGDLDRGSLQVSTPPAAGTAEVAGGQVRFTAPDAPATVTFGYRVCDLGGRCATSQVTVEIVEPDPPPPPDDPPTTPLGEPADLPVGLQGVSDTTDVPEPPAVVEGAGTTLP